MRLGCAYGFVLYSTTSQAVTSQGLFTFYEPRFHSPQSTAFSTPRHTPSRSAEAQAAVIDNRQSSNSQTHTRRIGWLLAAPNEAYNVPHTNVPNSLEAVHPRRPSRYHLSHLLVVHHEPLAASEYPAVDGGLAWADARRMSHSASQN